MKLIMNPLINFFATLYDLVIEFFSSLYDMVSNFFGFLLEYLKWMTNMKSDKPKEFSPHTKESIQVHNQNHS